MIAALGYILDGVMLIGTLVAWGIETVLNALLAVIVGLISLIFSLLPSMPTVPAPPDVIQTINWLFPVGGVLVIFTTFVTCWVVFLGVRIVMRWTKTL